MHAGRTPGGNDTFRNRKVVVDFSTITERKA